LAKIGPQELKIFVCCAVDLNGTRRKTAGYGTERTRINSEPLL
jgi:hypothetical protein